MALEALKEYWRPTDMGEALALLDRGSPRTVPLGGGAYLTTHKDPKIEAVVDLSALGLDAVEEAGAETWIGAMVRLDLLAAGVVPGRSGRFLARIARRQTSWQLRRSSTLGGALVTGTLPELDAMLWVLGAGVLLRGGSAGTLAFESFVDQRDHLPRGTLLTGVALPGLAAGEGAGSERVSRTPADSPTASAAVYVKRQGDRAAAVRLVVTGMAPRPIRLPALEQSLAGQSGSEALLDRVIEAIDALAAPPADIRGSGEYRRAMLGVCARRALIAAWDDAAGGDHDSAAIPSGTLPS
jgi:carbon-monoxide dehydrogenase medium subunit